MVSAERCKASIVLQWGGDAKCGPAMCESSGITVTYCFGVEGSGNNILPLFTLHFLSSMELPSEFILYICFAVQASSYPSTVLDRRHAKGANSPRSYRGDALLISMEGGKDRDRQGAAVDRGRMLSLFQTLFFSVSPFLDYSAEDLISKLKQKSEEIDPGTTDCFVCFVSAHGNTDADGSSFILDQSGNKVYILDHIIKPFMDSRLLRGKPKVFFINACRGNYHMTPDSRRAENTSDIRPATSRSAEKTVQYLRNHTDCLVVFSTGEGNQSGRSPTDGTYFVQALSEAVSLYYYDEDVLSMMTIMNKRLMDFKSDLDSKKSLRVCQGAVIESKLSSKLYWKTHSSEASGTGMTFLANLWQSGNLLSTCHHFLNVRCLRWPSIV